MSTDKYFEREYNFLQTAGEEFSKKHPTLGSRLHMSERERKDPFVERLMESFAFLAGRIHERLDDEFPEIAGGILNILFPHLLKPFPSCAVMQAKHKPGAISTPVVIKKGSEVQTPSGRYKVKYKVYAGPQEKSRITEKEEPAEFVFSTTQEIKLRPLKIDKVSVETSQYGTSSLILKFQPERNVNYDLLDLDHLRLYLHGSASIKFNLLYYLMNLVSSVHVRELSSPAASFRKLEEFRIAIPEITPGIEYKGDDYAILPYSRETFAGFRLMQEYFAFQEKFFFIDITGLNNNKGSTDTFPFEVKIDFTRKMEQDKYPGVNNILLHCSPVVNLFKRPSEEVIVSQRLPEYYLIPDLDRRKSREIYSIDKVTGVSEDKSEQYKYIPVTSHDILESGDPLYSYKRFYSTFRRQQLSDMADFYIRLFGPGMEVENFPKETLSIEATMSNGFLPSAYLEAGSIKESVNIPAGIEVSNITIPSEMFEPPEKQNYLWSLISHLSVSYNTLADTDSLKSILNLYNWIKTHNHSNKKRIEGIRKVHPPKMVNQVINGGLLRGIEFHVEVDPKEFENGEGDIFLMGSVLNAFLSQYVTLNSYILLKITESGTGKEYKWKPLTGQILPV
jgi:type VI secretion system protein ImpG